MDMTDERWKQVEHLFHAALEVPADEREALVAARCRDDPTLRAEVLALLRADSVVERLMSEPPAADSGALRREPPPSETEAADPWLGRRVGPFVLDRVLGRGGMGVVYLAHRAQGGLTQSVAVKLIARHLRDSPAVGQFLTEREVLGRLEHPHIARLLDGGWEEGTPYVVMEYVEGLRIDEVCDDAATPIATKLALFLQLCAAVTYVHGHLVLHRDLKPGNVMVTRAGAVKLLDFGTLKRVDVEAADSLLTRAGLRSVTLRYASPEMLAGGRISTATDVYSLGLILCRVLTGRLPPDSGAAHASDPEPALAELAATPSLRRDLEAIVAKALRHEPAQRFPSVAALAQDVRNALSDRPVLAREGTRRYRAAKFYRDPRDP